MIALDPLRPYLYLAKPIGYAAIASALVFAGIFVMRFAFYMMHLTVGLAV